VLKNYFTALRAVERSKIGFRGRVGRNENDQDLQRSDTKATRVAAFQHANAATLENFRNELNGNDTVKDFIATLESEGEGRASLCSAKCIPPGAPGFSMLSPKRMDLINSPVAFLRDALAWYKQESDGHANDNDWQQVSAEQMGAVYAELENLEGKVLKKRTFSHNLAVVVRAWNTCQITASASPA
jgi:hypothetical protein